MATATSEQIHTAITDHYAEAARLAADGGTAGSQEYTEALYPAEQRDVVPESPAPDSSPAPRSAHTSPTRGRPRV